MPYLRQLGAGARMGWKMKLLAVVIVVLVVLGAVGVYVYVQYKRLGVDLDRSQSGVALYNALEVQLRIAIRFTNDGAIDLLVPPTDFQAWADGALLGPGDTPEARVPAHGSATTQALLTVAAANAPEAYRALADIGRDTIRVKGDAHLTILGMTFDVPFDESFTVTV